MTENNPYAAVSKALVRALGRLRDRHADMTLQQAMTFFLVAQNPGITQRAIYETLGTNDSVASRTVAILSDVGSRNTPGLDLIEVKINPQDRRERILRLTPKGKRLMDDIVADFSRT